jgi:hypothetical protein
MNRREAILKTALLMGSALSATTMASILAGCQSGETGKNAQHAFALSNEQQALLEEITEVIVPVTDTPGAREAKVAATIELILKDCYKPEQQDHFLQGLADIDKESRKVYDNTFIHLSIEQKTAMLKQFEQSAKAEKARQEKPKENAKNVETNLGANAAPGSEQTQAKYVDAETGVVVKDIKKNAPLTPFFTLVKELTLLGYFSSEIGCTLALAYVPIPGRYEGVVKLKEGQRSWAT